MDDSAERQFVRGFWATSLGTLVSRVLGLVRDVVTAGLLGLGQGGVMDALVVALRLPNLARRILGEGALATSFLPLFTAEHERSREHAWRLLSSLAVMLTLVLIALVVVGEGIIFGIWSLGGRDESPLPGLTALLLPYLVFVCLAAQLAAALQGLGRFRVQAIAPALLNVCWLAAAWVLAPRWTGDRQAQAVVIAGAILASGVLQLVVLLLPLYRAGFRFQCDLRSCWPQFKKMFAAMLPISLGLAVTQINTLVDSLLAVLLSGPAGARFSLGPLGDIAYPLQTGAAAAIYYGERFYQLPVGLLGIALATVIYPTLARHAARGERARIGEDLTTGLRWVGFAALPAGVGLMLLAEPLMRLLFVRGAFTEGDAERAAAMIVCYASAAWAFCTLPIVVRGFYAVGDRTTPLRVGLLAVATDVVLSVLLVGPLAERGLAVSTALAAVVQVVLLMGLFSRRVPLVWSALRGSLAKSALATLAMVPVVLACLRLNKDADLSRVEQVWLVAITIASGAAAYALVAWLVGSPELRLLLRRGDAPRWQPGRGKRGEWKKAPLVADVRQ